MEDNGGGVMATNIPGVVVCGENLQQHQEEDASTAANNLISSNLAMVFSKLPELLAQAQHQLDSPSSPNVASSTEHYISCIKINGVPILPPVLDENSKKEMRMYREEAVRRSEEREKQKKHTSTFELSVPASYQLSVLAASPPGHSSKNDSNDLYDSLESSQPEAVLAQALASVISPHSHSSKGDQQVTTTTTRMPADSLSSIYWKPTDILLNSLSEPRGCVANEPSREPTSILGLSVERSRVNSCSRLHDSGRSLAESCSPAASELCLSLDLNSRLAALSPATEIFSRPPQPVCLISASSPLWEPCSDQNPVHTPENASLNVPSHSGPVFKAPIFLTEDHGLHLSVKKQSPTSVSLSPSLKESPVVSEKPWIMNSPLIAYVTKKRPKPVGMCSLSVKPDPLTKTNRINNATFTILRGVRPKSPAQDNDDKPQLKRPTINAERRRSSTPIPVLPNGSSPSPGKKASPKELASSPSKKYPTVPQPALSKSPCQNLPSSPKLQALSGLDINGYKFPGSPQIDNSKIFSPIGHHNSNNNNSIATDEPKVNLDDAMSIASSSLSSSPCDLSPKEHLGDDSLDELLLGVENIGLVPRIDGDGSDVPSPSSLSKDPANLPISGLSEPKETRQAWPKNTAMRSPELVRANFSPVGTDSPHHLQVSVAAADVTNSSGIASLCDLSADSPVTCMNKQPRISSSIIMDSDNLSNSGIRRGSYTLLEPSINLIKLAQLTPSPARNDHNNSHVSEKIPSYADFETALHKRVPSKNQGPKFTLPNTATPSRIATPVKHMSATKPFHSDTRSAVPKKPRKSMSPTVSKTKSANQMKKNKDSFHLTPQLPKTRNSPRRFQSERSKKHPKSTAIPQPITTTKTSPKTFKEWRVSNIDNKVTLDTPKRDIKNTKLRDEPTPTVSMDSPFQSPSFPSQALPPPSTPDSPFDWDNKIEDQMKCFFSEKKDSYCKLKQDFNDWQEKMDVAEVKFKKTLESITLSKQGGGSENWKAGLDFLTPDISFTSTEHGQMETPVKQLFVPQTQQPVSVVSVSTGSSQEVWEETRPPTKAPNPVLEKFPAVAKGFLVRRLLACPKVVSLRTTIQECQNLLEDMDYNSNIEFSNRINNQLESSRQEIHFLFFEKTVQEKMLLIRQARELSKREPIKKKVPQLSCATQKYQMRKKAEEAPVPIKRVVSSSLKQSTAVCSSSQSQKPVIIKKETAPLKPDNRPVITKETAQLKPDNRAVRKIAVPKKPCKVVSVATMRVAVILPATKAIAGPLRNNSYKPWR